MFQVQTIAAGYNQGKAGPWTCLEVQTHVEGGGRWSQTGLRESVLQVGLEMAFRQYQSARGDPDLMFTVLILCPPGKFKFYSQASVLKAPGQGDTA